MLFSCSPETTGVAPEAGGFVRGWVSLHVPSDTTILDLSGISVRLGESLQTQTRPDGSYLFEGLAGGSYPILAWREGYDTSFVQQVLVLPPAGAAAPEIVLDPVLDQQATLGRVGYDSNGVVVWIETNLSSTYRRQYRNAQIFIGRNPNVSADWNEHELYMDAYWDSSYHMTKVGLAAYNLSWADEVKRQPGKARLQAGDSAYAVMYFRDALEFRSDRLPFFDWSRGSYRYLNLRNPTNTVGFIVP